MINFEPLNKEKVKLDGTNLVEASAGTGKTYSIGLLALRLILEENIPVSRILLVTFTKPAVAELAARVRRFLREAIKAAEVGKCEEKTITDFVVSQENREEVIYRLKKALSDLDDASIQTIHSFCQESLNNFALDSGQPFGLELQPNVLGISQNYVHEFWRENIAVLPVEDLEEWGDSLRLDVFYDAVKEKLGGKEFADVSDSDAELYRNELSDFKLFLKEEKKDIIGRIREIKVSRFTTEKQDEVIERLEDFDSFKSWLLNNPKGAAYITNCWNEIFPEERKRALALDKCHQNVVNTLIKKCIKEVNQKTNTHLQKKHLLTYDEIITRMHQAVINNNHFKEAIREKFDAVFIDEFQDTDRLQYEIYYTLFGKGKILFYIGDPKQSIYGWRKADLNTYFAARKKIEEGKLFKMNINYRSSEAYVEAVNTLYSQVKNPFRTGGDGENDIQYYDVEAIGDNSTGLHNQEIKVKALEIIQEKTKEKIKTRTLCLVQELLNGKYTIGKEPVKKSDIGILVRANFEAREIKDILISAGFPAVTVDESKIFEDSLEAVALLNILEAILTANDYTINKALLSEFTGYGYKDLAQIEIEDLLDKFREYRETWVKSGVYAAVRQYMIDFNVTRVLMEANKFRSLTNLTQILELLQEAELRQELKPSGLFSYLQKQITGVNEEDEFQQRIESDEEAVKIITIHKAKGLEYPIVIAPFLDLKVEEKYNFCSFRDEEGNYKFYPSKKGSAEMSQLYKEQVEQENRRLIYVALTRAKYNCFVFKIPTKNKRTSLDDFTENAIIDSFKFNEDPQPTEQKKIELPKWKGVGVENFQLADHLTGNLSFSGISAHGAYIPKENNGDPTGYDLFIFKDMPRGTVIGDMLHLLFENIDFTGSEDHHREELEKLLDRFYPHKKEEYREGLFIMIKQVLNADIEIEGQKISLRDIPNSNKKNEMEFDLRTQNVDLVGLNAFDGGEGIELGCNTQHPAKSGLLTGFIDLLFKHEDKFYILDWKSNYLGDDLSYYDGEDQMKAAMNEGNYHLQYLIYSVAVKNYLEQRIPDFNYEEHFGGVIYVFLRGVRENKQTGIYTSKPFLKEIQQIESFFTTENLI
ncbi:UvrD-helicase domain-containing protein [Salegentibacter salarius]|uniref:RecBCD enzyme subunit RecB n=1 Tax=Salegentibacter salarius TaxID=435906 RepID=A0A2N0TX23_9FLAO|nr:UvrD-helicase domain-containing protein [Salegentibacter salarius]OEY72830.1 hypothetical protein BHS39_11345 [Salegentibacter salarius]PKD19290.1 hypothetical protein APR40_11325 [Salegentibacter salarius]SLK00037.1 DNA helicase/exodeoxyribonuclease V, beta subunit [Salegentibacter salarius]